MAFSSKASWESMKRAVGAWKQSKQNAELWTAIVPTHEIKLSQNSFFGRQSDDKLQTAYSLKIFQAGAHNHPIKLLKSIEERVFVRARTIWETAKLTVFFVLPEKGSFRRQVCHKKRRMTKKKTTLNAVWFCLLLMPQFCNYSFSHCGGEISGFGSWCRGICSFLVRLFQYYNWQSIINFLGGLIERTNSQPQN